MYVSTIPLNINNPHAAIAALHSFFYKNLFLIYMIMMLKNDQNLRTIAKNILRLKKSEEHLFCILHKIMEIIYFSVNVRQCNIIFGVKCVLILFISFLPARVAANSIQTVLPSRFRRNYPDFA